jgi:hypothetical protein
MQSGIFLLRYRTEMTDAGMPMPALVLRMPMPNYAISIVGHHYMFTESHHKWLLVVIIMRCCNSITNDQFFC